MPMNPKHYPKDWLSLRAAVLTRAKSCCECTGECGSTHEGERCAVPDHALIQRKKLDLASWVMAFAGETKLFFRPLKVILTTAHICQESSCNDLEHLRALCQCCHLRMDARQHVETRAKRKGAA